MTEAQEKRTPKQAAAGLAEDRSLIAEKLNQSLRLLAEAGEQLEKIAPKYKRLVDDARMTIRELDLLLQSATGDEAGVQRIVAPMPGVIMRQQKNVGEEVKEGEVVLILDAMKMENPITAPAAGKLVSLPHAIGEKVAKGAVIAAIAVTQKPGGKLRQVK